MKPTAKNEVQANSDATRESVARLSNGYVYCTTRSGVTGTRDELGDEAFRLFERLRALNAAPPLLGFGISTPDHVRRAIQAGAAGAVSGSVVVAAIEQCHDSGEPPAAVLELVQAMAQASCSVSPR